MIATLAILVLLLAATAGVLGLKLAQEREERVHCSEHCSALNRAYERLHSVSNSALRGHPLVKWRHPQPVPAADRWYWRARFEGVEHLFTDEQITAARQRADLHFPSKHGAANG